MPVHHDIDSALPSLSPEAELALYRVAQEELTNAVRHGEPSTVALELHRRERALVLRVRDDGHGMRPGRATADAGAGLAGMRERALLVGGRLRVDGAAGRGTTVELQVPVP